MRVLADLVGPELLEVGKGLKETSARFITRLDRWRMIEEVGISPIRV